MWALWHQELVDPNNKVVKRRGAILLGSFIGVSVDVITRKYAKTGTASSQQRKRKLDLVDEREKHTKPRSRLSRRSTTCSPLC